jgi:phenylalanyl-tRNA synthetase alpha chain
VNIDTTVESALAEIAAADTEATLRDLEVGLLGKKGTITELTRLIGAAPPAERGPIGKAINVAKATVTQALEARKVALVQGAIDRELADTTFDVSVPGARPDLGSFHPLTLVQERLEDIFTAMGFMVLDYGEVETDFMNFEALNIPKHHPARDMQDTFWTRDGHVLRTHTSPGQIRAMQQFAPPFRAAFPGKVFRNEALDASHEHTFHQLEGLFVDRVVSVAGLISTMKIMLSQVFEREVTVRLRPGYFPFVEPGFELDMQCLLCGGAGCRVCKHSGWVETLGCGLVHPNVLRHAGLDPAEWQAWAFGMGLSRLVMMRYGIDDIRHVLGGDLRFLQQFA